MPPKLESAPNHDLARGRNFLRSPECSALAAAAMSDGGNNGTVADAAGGDPRIDPRQMVARVPQEGTVSRCLVRVVIGAIVWLIVLTCTVKFLGPWSLLPSIVLGIAAALTTNPRRVLQIWAEIAGQPRWSISRSMPSGRTSLVSAADILPGDWVFRRDLYKVVLKDHQRKALMQLELAERRRAALGQAKEAGNNNDPAVTSDPPPIQLVLVIATGESAYKKKVALKFANGVILNTPRDERWYRWRPDAKPIDASIQKASLALPELLKVLAAGSRAESDLLDELSRSHCDDAVHRALRAALSSGMIKQHFGLGRFGQEAAATFSSRLDAKLRRRCVVSLSNAGTLWLQSSNAPKPRKETRDAAGSKSESSTTNHIHQTYNTLIFPQATAATSDPPVWRKRVQGAHPAVIGSERTDADKAASDAPALTLLAAIGGVSGTLASLLVNHPAQWQRAVFITASVICIVTLIFLIYALLSTVMSQWRRRHKVPGHNAHAGADPAEHETG